MSKIYPLLEKAAIGNEIIPVCSTFFCSSDTRFGKGANHVNTIEKICRRKMISTIIDAEPIGPVMKPDVMVIAPTTGNTLAKLNCGIYDTPVTLAAKACLREGRPLVIAFSSNDGLSGNFSNIAEMFCKKNIYFVPMLEDDAINKPFSLVADFSLIPDAITAASKGKQLFPLFKSATT